MTYGYPKKIRGYRCCMSLQLFFVMINYVTNKIMTLKKEDCINKECNRCCKRKVNRSKVLFNSMQAMGITVTVYIM